MTTGGVLAQQSAPAAPAMQPSANQTQKTAVKNRKPAAGKKSAAPEQQAPPQTMPQLPATLMNSAPVKPSVTMEGGLLTIDAPNSTLSDVLSGVHRATGATIEGASPTERVAVKLGPGNPEQVIAALLHGTPYGYVILGSPEKRDVITRVLLTQQSSAGPTQPSPPQPPPHQAMGQEQPDEGMPDRTVPDDAGVQQGSEEPEQNQQPQPEQQQPQQQQGLQPPTLVPQQQGQQTDQPQTQQQQQDPNQPKTPEQLFKELQQLEQQKQQQKY